MPYENKIVTYLFLVPIICIFGIVGNFLTLVVLIRGKFLGAAFVYLRGLAIFDMLGLVFILPISLIRCPVCDFKNVYALTFYEAYFYICIGDIFLKASVLTTLLLTIERCVVIVFGRRLNLSNQKSKFPLFALIGIFFFTMLENLPTIWVFSIDPKDGAVTLTPYSGSLAYKVYLWFDAVLFQFVPFVILFTFNIILAVYLVKHRQANKSLQRNLSSASWENRFTSERRTLLMLVGIIGMFLVTMLPCSIMQLIGISLNYGSGLYTHFQMAVTVLVSVNFSCNFLLYCTLNKRFWFVSKSLLCQCCRCFCSKRVSPLEQASSSQPWQTSSKRTVGKRTSCASCMLRKNSEDISVIEETADRKRRGLVAGSPTSAQTVGSRVFPDDGMLTDFVYQGPTNVAEAEVLTDAVYQGPNTVPKSELRDTAKASRSGKMTDTVYQGTMTITKSDDITDTVYQGTMTITKSDDMTDTVYQGPTATVRELTDSVYQGQASVTQTEEWRDTVYAGPAKVTTHPDSFTHNLHRKTSDKPNGDVDHRNSLASLGQLERNGFREKICYQESDEDSSSEL